MIKTAEKKLLKDGQVVQEIERHKWFESEKAGYDIGFEKAAEDWLHRFSKDWQKTNGATKSPRASTRRKTTKKTK